MAKVIIERPRRKGFGYRKGKSKGSRRRLQRFDIDELPRRESLRPYGSQTKEFSDLLGPLHRFLESRVGRPWNSVHAEICQRICKRSAVQSHLLDHVAHMVDTKVVLVDGIPCCGVGQNYGKPLAKLYRRAGRLYVCPVTGLLRRVKPKRREG
jgi:hypothetical protein